MAMKPLLDDMISPPHRASFSDGPDEFAPPAATPPALRAGHYAWLTLALLVLTVYGSLVPFHYRALSFGEALADFQSITVSTPTDLGARGDWVISVVLFGILSFCAMGMLGADRPRTESYRVAPLVILACAALSLGIEFTQVFFPPRTVSVNDLLLQALGGCLGTAIWLVAGQRITRWAGRLRSATGVAGLAKRLWPGYLVLLVATQLMPFDFIVSAAELAVKFEEGKIWLVPFAMPASKGPAELLTKAFIHTLCFAPLGLLWVLAANRGPDQRTHWPRVAVLGLILAGVVEGLQLFVYSRYFDSTDIPFGAAAVMLGWYAGEVFQSRWHQAMATPGQEITPRWPTAVWAGLFSAWLATVLYLNWAPFNFTTDPAAFAGDFEELTQHGMRRFAWLPIVDYYWGSKYNALDQLLKKTLSFAPLGIIFTLWLRRLYQPGMDWFVVGLALAFGAIVEAGAYFLPGRAPSTTDLFIACFGAWLGFRLTQHIRVVFWAERALFGYLHQFNEGQAEAYR